MVDIYILRPPEAMPKGLDQKCSTKWVWSRTKNQFEKDPISCCDMWSEISKGFMRLFEAAILELPLTFYVHKDWIYLCKKSKKKISLKRCI